MTIEEMTPQRIKRIRSGLEVTQEEFSDLIGAAGRSCVCKLESGAYRPTRSQLMLLEQLEMRKPTASQAEMLTQFARRRFEASNA